MVWEYVLQAGPDHCAGQTYGRSLHQGHSKTQQLFPILTTIPSPQNLYTWMTTLDPIVRIQ